MIPAYNRVRRAVSEPTLTAYRVRAKLDPTGLYRRYRNLALQQGVEKLYFILSFDCDILEDIAVVEGMNARLLDMGVSPVYAVPGELLKKGEHVYRRLLESGAEFINHGYTEHTYFDERRGDHASCFFYDQLPFETVRQDITQGDACLKEVLGVTPAGFRAPHFGTFQRPDQLRFMHTVLAELGYRFSTSTTPFRAFHDGPVYEAAGILEIPVSGMGSSPLTILDSWGCFKAPDRVLGESDYYNEALKAAQRYQSQGVGVLNYYVDPSHVHDKEVFYETVQYWMSVAHSVNYRSLLEQVNAASCNRAV